MCHRRNVKNIWPGNDQGVKNTLAGVKLLNQVRINTRGSPPPLRALHIVCPHTEPHRARISLILVVSPLVLLQVQPSSQLFQYAGEGPPIILTLQAGSQRHREVK